jgi:hypothetical protein
MATGAPTLDRPVGGYEARDEPSSREVAIYVAPSEAASGVFDDARTTRLWQQVDAILRRSLVGDQARELLASASGRTEEGGGEDTGRRTVAPGIVVSSEEYERRFGGIDLDTFRRTMPAEVFAAFVRHLGAIDGRGDQTDVVEISSVPDR